MNDSYSYYPGVHPHLYSSSYDGLYLPPAYRPVYWTPERDFPPVDTKILTHSVTAFQRLMKDASLLLSKLADPQIAKQIMAAAQTGNQQEVDRIVRSFGCECSVKTSYSPSSVQFEINTQTHEVPCCLLSMSLKWGR
ncbi:hypothetical protein [Paenibacillus sp. SI8]|uniref:hypothetical protein n=1 Tax=unclassified Paenibacillus TaxID=185978 RepID=UPI00346771FD